MATIKRYILSLIVLLATTMAGAQGIATWIETVHDFGTFPEEKNTVTCTMRVVNTGDSALAITRVQPNCGCTVAQYSHQVMQPGDTGSVTLTYNARHIPGQFEKKVLVYTTGHPRKTVLTITGKVIGTPETVSETYPFAVGPVRLNTGNLPLGEIYKGKATDAYISGYNTATDTMLVSLGKMPATISAHVVPDTVEPGGLFIVSIYYRTAQAPLWGLNVDTLDIYSRPLRPSATATSGAAHIDVMCNVKEDFTRLSEKQRRNAPVVELSTSKIDFEDVAPNDPVQRTLTINNTGKSTLKLRRLFVPGGEGITATCDKAEVKPGKQATVTITLNPALHSGKVLNTTLNVITNDPYTSQSLVRLVGLIH